jgi:hypothetical protein
MFMLYIMAEGPVFFGQLLALQGDGTVGWMTKELSINMRQGKSFLSSSKHPDNL